MSQGNRLATPISLRHAEAEPEHETETEAEAEAEAGSQHVQERPP